MNNKNNVFGLSDKDYKDVVKKAAIESTRMQLEKIEQYYRKDERKKVLRKVNKEINRMMQSYVNTPLSKRRNAFDELWELEKNITNLLQKMGLVLFLLKIS